LVLTVWADKCYRGSPLTTKKFILKIIAFYSDKNPFYLECDNGLTSGKKTGVLTFYWEKKGVSFKVQFSQIRAGINETLLFRIPCFHSCT